MTQLQNNDLGWVDKAFDNKPDESLSWVDDAFAPATQIASTPQQANEGLYRLYRMADISLNPLRGFQLLRQRVQSVLPGTQYDLAAESVAGIASGTARGAKSLGGLMQMASAADRRLGEPLKFMFPGTNANALQASGEFIAGYGEAAQSLVPPSETEGFGLRRIIYTISESAPQMAASVGAGMATGGLGTVASIAAFSVTSAGPVVGETYHEARRDWIERGYSVAQAENLAATEATVVGTLSAVLEKFPGAAIFTKNQAAKQAITRAILDRAKKVGVAALAEGSTEVLQGIVEDAGKYLIREDGTAFEDFWERRAMEAIVGSVMGGSAKTVVGDAPTADAPQPQIPAAADSTPLTQADQATEQVVPNLQDSPPETSQVDSKGTPSPDSNTFRIGEFTMRLTARDNDLATYTIDNVDGRVVGSVQIERLEDTGQLHVTSIGMPGARGKGLGRQATQAAANNLNSRLYSDPVSQLSPDGEKAWKSIATGKVTIGDEDYWFVDPAGSGNPILDETPEQQNEAETRAKGGTGGAIGAMAADQFPDWPVGITKESREIERDRSGIPAPLEPVRFSNQEAFDQATKRLADNPNAADEIAIQLSTSERAANPVESAMLLIRWGTLKAEHNSVTERMFAAQEAGDMATYTDLKAREEALYQQRASLDESIDKIGTAKGRALQAHKMFINEDFTLASMLNSARAAQGGKPLTNEQVAEFKALHDKIAALEKQVAEARNQAGEAKFQQTFDKMVTKADKAKPSKKAVETPEEFASRHDPAKKPSPAKRMKFIQSVARMVVSAGVRDRNILVSEVHRIVSPLYPNMTLTEVRDAISGYGDFKRIKMDETSKVLRDLKTQLQLVAKIESVQAGISPLKTGFERGELSDEARALTAQYNELKKELNIVTTDPARQLKSALAAAKTRMKHQIADLSKQIKEGKKIVKTKRDQPMDDELRSLVAQRDALREQFNAIFGKSKMTEAQRIAVATRAVERALADMERRIKEHDFSERGKAPKPDTPELRAARARLKSMRALYDELRENDPKAQASDERKALAQLKRKLTKRFADYHTRIVERKFHRRNKKPGPELDAEAESLQMAVSAIKDRWRTELHRVRRREQLTRENAELRQQLASGRFPPKPVKQEKNVTDEIRRLEIEREQLKQIRDIEIQRKQPKSVFSWLWEPFHLGRMIQLGLDFGQVLNQGKFATFAHPIVTARNLAPMVRAFVGRDAEAQVMESIRSHELYVQAHDAGLQLTHEDKGLTQQEELFQGHLSDRLPVLRNFSRAYRTFLNKLRFDLYVQAAKNLSQTGTPTKDEARVIANMINVATGRGAVNQKWAGTFAYANQAFLAPRFQLSRAQMLLGQPIWGARGDTSTRRARWYVAKEYGRIIAGAVTYYTLLHILGSFIADDDDEKPKIETDPRSSDFMKVQIGKTRVDPMAGVMQWFVAISRFGSGEVKMLDGDTREFDVKDAGRFLRGRLAPAPGAIWDRFIARETIDRQEPTVRRLMQNMFTPIAWNDIKDGVEEHGITKGAAIAIMALLGERISTYIEQEEKKRGSRVKVKL